MKKKVCVVTGTRADFGLLKWVMKELESSEQFELMIVATGAHLSKDFGHTIDEVKNEFLVHAEIDMLVGNDSALDVARSMAQGVRGSAEALAKLRPDLLLVLGDRYEILATVESALFLKIPVAHIAGGDLTEGAFDESIRHSITKMSHIHFPTNAQAANRLVQMGEQPHLVFNCGSPGLDGIKHLKPETKASFEKKFGFSFGRKNILVTYHPETLSPIPPEKQIEIVLTALTAFTQNGDWKILLTKTNADTGGLTINRRLEEYATNNKAFATCVTSLGSEGYLSALGLMDMVVGNSSSGLYEVPSFGIPTVNIGNRQKGRLRASSVLDVALDTEKILATLKTAEGFDCKDTQNPYGDGQSAPRIVKTLASLGDFSRFLHKPFYEVQNG